MNSNAPNGVYRPMNALTSEHFYLSRNDVCKQQWRQQQQQQRYNVNFRVASC